MPNGRAKRRSATYREALERFAALLGLDPARMKPHEQDGVFERYAALHLVRLFAPDVGPEDLPAFSTGAVDDTQLDAMAFLHQGGLLRGPGDVDAVFAAGEPTTITIVAAQVTSSQRFDGVKVTAFGDGLRNFFSDASLLEENAAVAAARALKDRLIAEAAERGVEIRFDLNAFFVSDAASPPEKNALGRFGIIRKSLLEMRDAPIVSAEVEPVDRRRLGEIVAHDHAAEEYATEAAPYSGVAPSNSLAPLPTLRQGELCWIGAIDIASYLKILAREDSQGLKEGIFEHNVRGDLRDTPVNQRIVETLTGDRPDLLSLYSNGVTLVAEEVAPEGRDGLRLWNFQIVNGLQTTHVIWRLRDHIAADPASIMLPVKIVATSDDALRRRIVDATNRHNPVLAVALLANTPTVVALERFLQRRALEQPGWGYDFKRRIDAVAPPGQRRSINLAELARAYLSFAQAKPHVAEQGDQPALQQIGQQILHPDHRHAPYATAGLALVAVRDALSALPNDERLVLNTFEHHLVYALRILLEPGNPPNAAFADIDAWCAPIDAALLDPIERARIVASAAAAVTAARDAVAGLGSARPMQTAALTTAVREAALERRAQ